MAVTYTSPLAAPETSARHRPGSESGMSATACGEAAAAGITCTTRGCHELMNDTLCFELLTAALNVCRRKQMTAAACTEAIASCIMYTTQGCHELMNDTL